MSYSPAATKRAQARVTARRLIRDHGLPMKVIGVDYVDKPPVFTVYFRERATWNTCST